MPSSQPVEHQPTAGRASRRGAGAGPHPRRRRRHSVQARKPARPAPTTRLRAAGGAPHHLRVPERTRAGSVLPDDGPPAFGYANGAPGAPFGLANGTRAGSVLPGGRPPPAPDTRTAPRHRGAVAHRPPGLPGVHLISSVTDRGRTRRASRGWSRVGARRPCTEPDPKDRFPCRQLYARSPAGGRPLQRQSVRGPSRQSDVGHGKARGPPTRRVPGDPGNCRTHAHRGPDHRPSLSS